MKLNVDHPLVDQILNRLYVQGDVGLYLINAIQDTATLCNLSKQPLSHCRTFSLSNFKKTRKEQVLISQQATIS